MLAATAHATIAGVMARQGVTCSAVRAFATQARDLDIDFTAPRAVVVTELLSACLHDVDGAAWWELPISTRTTLLVAVSELSMPPIEIHLTCRCGEMAELELTAAELSAFAEERARELPIARHGDVEVRLRLPTGRDQLRWTALAAEERDAELTRRMLSDLVIEGPTPLPDEVLPGVDQVLAHCDPLVELRLESSCPACDAPLTKDVDLEAIALSRLSSLQRAWIADIHALASAYHWSEEQIVRLPAWRRDEYLTLLGRSRA